MDLPSLLPLIGALIAAGVAVYLARSNRDSLIAATTKNTVEAVGLVLDRQKAEITALTETLSATRERLAVLEAQHRENQTNTEMQATELRDCRQRVVRLIHAVESLGGHVNVDGNIEVENG